MAAGGRAKPAIGPGHDPEGRARWEDLRDEARTARARLARGELVESNAGADKCGYLAQRNPPATGWTRHWSVLYTAQKRLDFYAHAEDVASHQRIDRVDLTGARAEAVGSGKTTRPNCFMLRVATGPQSSDLRLFQATDDEERTAWLYAIHDSIVRDSPSTTELRRTMASGRAPAPAIEAYAAADAAADEHDSAPPAPSGRCHRGWLVKRGGFVKSWKRRYVVVDPPARALSWYASERNGEEGKRPKGSIRLVGATIQREKGTTFRVLTEGRVLVARADSESDAEQWVAAIRRAISGDS